MLSLLLATTVYDVTCRATPGFTMTLRTEIKLDAGEQGSFVQTGDMKQVLVKKERDGTFQWKVRMIETVKGEGALGAQSKDPETTDMIMWMTGGGRAVRAKVGDMNLGPKFFGDSQSFALPRARFELGDRFRFTMKVGAMPTPVESEFLGLQPFGGRSVFRFDCTALKSDAVRSVGPTRQYYDPIDGLPLGSDGKFVFEIQGIQIDVVVKMRRIEGPRAVKWSDR